jgi:hypothetical protein
MISNGWGTWIRTKIDGVRVRSSTVELSPNGRLKARFAPERGASIAKRRGGRKRFGPIPRRSVAACKSRREHGLDTPLGCLDLLHRHDSGRCLEGAGDRRADRIAARKADFDLALLRPEDQD